MKCLVEWSCFLPYMEWRKFFCCFLKMCFITPWFRVSAGPHGLFFGLLMDGLQKRKSCHIFIVAGLLEIPAFLCSSVSQRPWALSLGFRLNLRNSWNAEGRKLLMPAGSREALLGREGWSCLHALSKQQGAWARAVPQTTSSEQCGLWQSPATSSCPVHSRNWSDWKIITAFLNNCQFPDLV